MSVCLYVTIYRYNVVVDSIYMSYLYLCVRRKRQMLRQEDEFDIGKNLLENVLEMGMSTARAAIHLGRAYKNTK